MTVDTKTQNVAQLTATLPIPEADKAFDWKNCWYPVTFLQDLPKDRPYSFSLYDEPLVLFTDQEGKLVCLIDRCPHRAAKLSDGQIIDGKIECLYHGWQFGSDGECLHIPQLPADAKIPAKACLQSFKVVERQGIVWMWAGEPEAADDKRIPTIADVDKPEFVTIDHVSDRPYDQTYLLENLIDAAHFPISHHGSLSNRQNAQPLEMEVLETSVEGIRGRVRETRHPNGNWINFDFVAPNFLVSYQVDLPKPGSCGGAAIYSLPLGKGRCRVLVRNYRNFLTWKIKLKPRWLDHLFRNRLFEEDLPFIMGQQANIERLGKNLDSLYLPLKTSDTLPIEYRKWLDKYGLSLPFYQGYSTSKPHVLSEEETPPYSVLSDRFSRHTQICSSCMRIYQIINRLKQGSVAVAIAFGTLAIVTDNSWGQIVAVSLSLSAVALAVVAQTVKTKFERSYTRR